MGKIAKLDTHTINSIAAGEVIDRPASVVKELVDNALDAGAGTIRVDIAAGGIREIRVRDDGTGMSPEDAAMSLLSHTTSKLRSVADLDRLSSMGFRGEALASIAAVSRLTLITREIGSEEGVRIEMEGGEQTFAGPHGTAEGTSVTVRDLFYNTPARYKFLKSDQAEAAQVAERLSHLALTRPDVSIQLERDGKTVLHTPGNSDLHSAVYAVFGQALAENMQPVSHAVQPIRIEGFMSTPAHARNNRSRQVFIVNGRVIRSRVLQVAVDEACATYFMKGRHPALVFHLTLPPVFVDVNVHPQKSEVRFWDDKKVFSAVYHAVRRVLEDDQPRAAVSEPADAPAEPDQLAMPFASISPQADAASALAAGEPAGTNAYLPVMKPEPAVVPAASVLPASSAAAVQQQDKRDTSERDIASLLEGIILGQFLNTYIVMQVRDRLILIDQHAAHERILYERLRHAPLAEDAARAGRQPLLVPAEIHVTPEEAHFIDTQAARLLDMGFELEAFGPATYILRSAPDIASYVDPAALFAEWLDALSGNAFTEDARFRDLFALKACKAAVKAKQALSENEMEQLIVSLQTLDNPYHCPHGRPITVALTKTEIEKRFGRIV